MHLEREIRKVICLSIRRESRVYMPTSYLFLNEGVAGEGAAAGNITRFCSQGKNMMGGKNACKENVGYYLCFTTASEDWIRILLVMMV